MATRAETLTGTAKKEEHFSDFLDSFAKTPFGGQLGRVVDEQSVIQSIKNLIRTNLGERLYQPQVGSGVNAMLFELNDLPSHAALEFQIKNTLTYNEPRILLIDVDVDYGFDEHEVEVTIKFMLINKTEPTTLTFLLKRVR